jgi:hypothetical protein
MADKPTALRLAGYWAAKNDQGEYLYSSLRFREETAAELRRLVAENALLHERHHFDNGVLKELLEALRSLIDMDVAYRRGPKVEQAVDVARAAIAKAERNKP